MHLVTRTNRPVARGLILLAIAAVFVPATLLLKEVSTDRYTQIVGWNLTLPSRLTEVLMLALIAGFGLAAWGFSRIQWPRIVTALMAGIGVIFAYGLSEAIKIFFNQERPCRAVVELAICPEVGDWSFPSNHSAIAFAVATGIVIITANKWANLAYIGALGVGVLRVVTGAHYPHDVLAGAILGICVTLAVYLLLSPLKTARERQLNSERQLNP